MLLGGKPSAVTAFGGFALLWLYHQLNVLAAVKVVTQFRMSITCTHIFFLRLLGFACLTFTHSKLCLIAAALIYPRRIKLAAATQHGVRRSDWKVSLTVAVEFCWRWRHSAFTACCIDERFDCCAFIVWGIAGLRIRFILCVSVARPLRWHFDA